MYFPHLAPVWTRGQVKTRTSKNGVTERLRCGTVEKEMIEILQFMTVGRWCCKKNSVLSCMDRRAVDGCDHVPAKKEQFTADRAGKGRLF